MPKITPSEFVLLKMIEGSPTQLELAKKSGIKHQTMYAKINRLELKGVLLVNHINRHYSTVHLTKLGRKLINGIH